MQVANGACLQGFCSREGALVVAIASLKGRKSQQALQMAGISAQRLPPQPPRRRHPLPLRLPCRNIPPPSL